ncbi:hypothetical protein VNO77_26874 [Canavalia gladiata]|uniref:HMA domain-containing protein n=1 Tax=Canavalia gladiata TaxID=3824 RepID=A0AAN9Q5Z6_CANGL
MSGQLRSTILVIHKKQSRGHKISGTFLGENQDTSIVEEIKRGAVRPERSKIDAVPSSPFQKHRNRVVHEVEIVYSYIRFMSGGMTSATCVNSIKDILRSLTGVKIAMVALATSLGEVEYDPKVFEGMLSGTKGARKFRFDPLFELEVMSSRSLMDGIHLGSNGR